MHILILVRRFFKMFLAIINKAASMDLRRSCVVFGLARVFSIIH